MSNIKLYRADSFEDAYRLIHHDLGPNAIILESRAVEHPRLFPWGRRSFHVEVMVEPPTVIDAESPHIYESSIYSEYPFKGSAQKVQQSKAPSTTASQHDLDNNQTRILESNADFFSQVPSTYDRDIPGDHSSYARHSQDGESPLDELGTEVSSHMSENSEALTHADAAQSHYPDSFAERYSEALEEINQHHPAQSNLASRFNAPQPPDSVSESDSEMMTTLHWNGSSNSAQHHNRNVNPYYYQDPGRSTLDEIDQHLENIEKLLLKMEEVVDQA